MCHIPDLLQELAVYCAFNCPHQTDEECTQRLLGLRSLPPWLEQHGAALRSFTFSVHIGENVRLEPEHWREAQDQMPVAVMQAVGRGCAQLQHLSLDADRACNWFDVQPLLQPVSTLSSLLSLEVSGDVSHGALPFKGLTHLTRFKTAGLLTSDRAQALRQLPPSLLELDVTLQNYRDLPLGVPVSNCVHGRSTVDALANLQSHSIKHPCPLRRRHAPGSAASRCAAESNRMLSLVAPSPACLQACAALHSSPGTGYVQKCWTA